MKSISQYTQANMLVLPDALLSMRDARLLYQQGNNAFFHKDLESDLINVEFFSKTPCVVYIESGQECITNSSNQPITLASGTATILPQGLNLHSDYVKSTNNLKAYLVFFDESIIQDFLKTQPVLNKKPDNSEALLKIKASQPLNIYFEMIKALKKNDLMNPSLMRLKQLELLHILSLNTNQSILAFLQSTKQSRNPKRNLQRLLNESPVHGLSVSDLTHLSGRSPSSFNRDFKAIYNMSPKQWLQEKRLQHANLLLTQNTSVTQVANELGYENISHFISLFKKRFNLTPKQFQQNGKK